MRVAEWGSVPRKARLRAGAWLLAGLLGLAGCGGGGGGGSNATTPPAAPEASAYPAAPAVPAHAAATVALTAGNTPLLMAQSMAVLKSLHRWIGAVISTTGAPLSPAQATGGYVCGTGGKVEARYQDLDGNGKESVGDRIQVSGTDCSLISPLGEGSLTVDVLAVTGTDFTDARVVADGLLDRSSLWHLYGWSQRLQGGFRFVQTRDDRIVVQSQGPVQLTLAGGQVLHLSNLWLAYTVSSQPLQGTSLQGQFDLQVESGPQAGARVQVDTVGALTSMDVPNLGPEPGPLQLTGLQGSRARLRGSFENGVGAMYETEIDASGSGQFTRLSRLVDVAFYSAVRP